MTGYDAIRRLAAHADRRVTPGATSPQGLRAEAERLARAETLRLRGWR